MRSMQAANHAPCAWVLFIGQGLINFFMPIQKKMQQLSRKHLKKLALQSKLNNFFNSRLKNRLLQKRRFFVDKKDVISKTPSVFLQWAFYFTMAFYYFANAFVYLIK